MFEAAHKPELYPVFAFIGVAAGTFIYYRYKPKSYFSGETGRLYTAFIVMSGVTGAYLATPLNYLIASNQQTPGEFVISKSLIVALFFTFLAADIAKYFIGVKGPTGEAFALSLPLTLGISRFGCVFAHCCYGRPSDSFFALVNAGVSCYPAPLYESFFHLSCFVILLASFKLGFLEGYRLRFYLLAYALFRFFTEFYRGYPPVFYGLSLYQLFAVGLMILVIRALIFDPTIK